MIREERDALRAQVDRRKIDRDVPPDVENLLDDLLDALDATEAEVAAFQSWKDESVWVAEVHRARTERDEARAEVERLRADLEAVEARAEQAEAVIARVRALTEDEWGPLSDDGERCALCRRKWSKHGNGDEHHHRASSGIAGVVRIIRAALDGETT